jgi:hemolysin activation/secretion protein
MRGYALRLVALTLALGAASGFAQTGASDSPRFEIREIKVEGNTLLTRDALDRTFAPFVGSGRDFGDVQRALEALENAYTQAGYGAIQVALPEQELTQGVVTFKVTESKIGNIVFEGNRLFDEANVRNSLPSLKEGQVPNVHRMGENLHLANENPAKQTAVVLRNTEKDGEVDAVVRVAEQNPLKFSLSLDNTGTTETGQERLGLGFQHANVFNRDQVLTGQLLGSPTKADKVAIVGLGYRIPIYGWGDTFDITAGYSNVSSGTLLNLYSVSGKGSIGGLRYNMQLPRFGDIEQKLSFGLDYRAFRNDITLMSSGAQQVPDITLHPVSLTYAGLSRLGTSEINYFLSAFRNLPGGNDGGSGAFDLSRSGARADYLLFRYGVNVNKSFSNDWQMRVALTGQETRDALVSGEQFGMGGFDNVRGFLEREVANDRGYRGNLELYTPDFGTWFGNNWRVRALGFHDAGRVFRNHALPAEITAISIASTGLGIRLAYANSVTIRVDYAIVTDAGGTQGKGDARLHASFIFLF